MSVFKAQIKFVNNDGNTRKCTMVIGADDHIVAPAEIKSIATAYFSAKPDSVEILSLDGCTGNFSVLGRWPT